MREQANKSSRVVSRRERAQTLKLDAIDQSYRETLLATGLFRFVLCMFLPCAPSLLLFVCTTKLRLSFFFVFFGVLPPSFFILIPSFSSVHTNSHTHNHVRFEVHPQGPRLRRPPPRLRYTLKAHYSLTHHLHLSPSRKISFSSPVLQNWRFLARKKGKGHTIACPFFSQQDKNTESGVGSTPGASRDTGTCSQRLEMTRHYTSRSSDGRQQQRLEMRDPLQKDKLHQKTHTFLFLFFSHAIVSAQDSAPNVAISTEFPNAIAGCKSLSSVILAQNPLFQADPIWGACEQMTLISPLLSFPVINQSY